MNDDTHDSAAEVEGRLLRLLGLARRDTFQLLDRGEVIPIAVHFQKLREHQREISDLVNQLERIVKDLSEHSIPTIFTNMGASSLTLDGIGRVTVATKWHCSMPEPEKGRIWLTENGAEDLIIETVNAGSLTKHAKESLLAGNPLPSELFNLTTTNYTSITKD